MAKTFETAADYVALVRQRHAHKREGYARLVTNLEERLRTMGVAAALPDGTILNETEMGERSAQDRALETQFADHLAKGGFLGCVAFVDAQLFLKKGERMADKPLEQVMRLDLLEPWSSCVTTMRTETGPWKDVSLLEAHAERLFLTDEAAFQAVCTLGQSFLQAPWDTKKSVYAHTVIFTAQDFPLRVANWRRWKVQEEQGRDLLNLQIHCAGAARRALSEILSLEGVPGAEALTEAWRRPLEDLIDKGAEARQARHLLMKEGNVSRHLERGVIKERLFEN